MSVIEDILAIGSRYQGLDIPLQGLTYALLLVIKHITAGCTGMLKQHVTHILYEATVGK